MAETTLVAVRKAIDIPMVANPKTFVNAVCWAV
jgi:hypothetical protein